REDVADVHVDRARTEEELAGDLAVRASFGNPPHDLELAPAQVRAAERRRGLPAEAALDRLAHRVQLGGDAARERPRPEPARGPVGVHELLDTGLALSGGGEGGSGAELRLRRLEREAERAQDPESAPEARSR